MRRHDGLLVEGVIDLAFREPDSEFGGWTIVDFKTDREFDAASARYVNQVKLYCEGVAAATGLLARGTLFVL
jgi:ATP-dependent exoDNAse (exonuclease V) beta subunit